MLIANVYIAVGRNKGKSDLVQTVTDDARPRPHACPPHPGLNPEQVRADLQPQLRRVMAHIDTVGIRPIRPMTPDELRQVRRLCGSAFPVRSRWDRVQANVPRDYSRGYILQQPTDDVFRYLEDLFGADCRITRLDVAVEYLMADDQAVWALRDFLNTHYTERKCPKDGTGNCFATVYTRRNRRAAVCAKTYPARGGRSKLTGEPHCLRVEWTIKGGAAVARRGGGTLSALRKLDLHAFVRDHLTLHRVDPERLAKLHARHVRGCKIAMSSHIWLNRLRGAKAGPTLAATVLARQAQTVRPMWSVMELKARCPYPIGRALERLDHDWLLPSIGCPLHKSASRPCSPTDTGPGHIRSLGLPTAQSPQCKPTKQSSITSSTQMGSIGSGKPAQDNLEQFIQALCLLSRSVQGTRTPYPISSPVAGTRPVRSREGRAALRCGNGMGGRAPP